MTTEYNSNSNSHHRRSIRLRGYDYSQAGAYFVTICAQNRECLFGEITQEGMQLNSPGQLIQDVWQTLPAHYPGVDLDYFVVMPNHVHGIILLVGTNPGIPSCEQSEPDTRQPQGVAPTLSLPEVVHRFKSLTTTRYIQGVKQQGWQSFPGKLWQRNYYERIIRDEDELKHIREYVLYNPNKWMDNTENPVFGMEDFF